VSLVAVGRGPSGGSQALAAGRLLDWRELLDLAGTIATVEGFVPRYLVGRPPAILATLLAGQELGLGPMASLRAVVIIDGRVSLYAEAARALVYAAGHVLEVEADDQHATARGRRRDESNLTVVEWTIDRARRARLADRPVWRAYPRQMLTARATSELCRVKFSDALLGLDIAEDLADVATPGEPPSPEPPRTVTRQVFTVEPPPLPVTPTEAATTPPTAVEPPQLPGEEGYGEPLSAPSASGAGTLPEGQAGREDEAPPDRGSAPAGPVLYQSTVAMRRLHARTAETFPAADRVGIDRLRHSIVALVTRSRDDGPVQSSSLLTDEELNGYAAVLNFVENGRCIIGERPDGGFEFRQDGWLYIIHLDPPEVETIREAG